MISSAFSQPVTTRDATKLASGTDGRVVIAWETVAFVREKGQFLTKSQTLRVVSVWESSSL